MKTLFISMLVLVFTASSFACDGTKKGSKEKQEEDKRIEFSL